MDPEKEHKRSLDDDKTKIEYFLRHFSGRDISTITADRVNRSPFRRWSTRKHIRVWESRQDAAIRRGKASAVC